VYELADLIFKVKQPLESEVGFYRKGQGVSCFHHIAANRNTVEFLLRKGAVILPWESHSESLAAMSKEVGPRIVWLLDKLCPDWRKRQIFILGARGTVGQYAILALLSAGGALGNISCCDLYDGLFFSDKTGLKYHTFSSKKDDVLRAQLGRSSIFIFAAVGKNGAPRVIGRSHFDNIRPGSLIIHVSIDEGGNTDDPEFQKLTSWDDPVYTVNFGNGNSYSVCNIPNFPGCVKAEESSRALVEANLPYYVELISNWPNVPEKYWFKGFEDGAS
jgi:alanine dehydrogenase